MSGSGSRGIWSVFQAAADVGGVGGPVPAGDLLPLDRGRDVDAASCVMTRRAATAWRVRRTPASFSQSSMRSGRSTRTRASRSRPSSGTAAPPSGVRICFSFRSREQRVHSAVDSCQVCWQTPHRFQKAGSGLRQRAHNGPASVPPFSGAPAPQREQVIQRLRHRSHTGVPVAREMPIRPPPADPQMLQDRAGPGRQLWQTGPASVTAATRRRFPHLAQGFQLRGSRRQQFWQMGCPPSLQRATELTFPHRPQSRDRALLRHPPHRRSPSTGTSSRRCLPQRGQAGSTTAAAPARASALMNRKMPGKGARAPWPVSRSGWAATAAAMRRRPSGRAAAWPSAPRTTSGLSAGSSSAIRASRAPAGSPGAGPSGLPVTGASR